MILIDKDVPQGFHVKKFLKDVKLEENASVELVRWFGFPDPPPRDAQVDLYYPEIRLFFEIHEGQHLWPGHSIYSRKYSSEKTTPLDVDTPAKKTAIAWEQQRKGDVEKMKKFLEMGFYGAVLLAVNGPFSSNITYDEAIEKQPWLKHVQDVDITHRWTDVSPIEIRKRASIAAQVMLSEREHNYARGDYKGKVFLFSTPSTEVDQIDGAQVGKRFLFFDDLREYASSITFENDYEDMLKKSHELSVDLGSHRKEEGIGLPIRSLDRKETTIYPGGTVLSRSRAQLTEFFNSLFIW